MPEYKTVAELLEDPARWCQGALARDAEGYACYDEDKHAVSFCLFGAVCRVYRGEDAKTSAAALRMTLSPAWPNIARFNDAPTTTHADVLNLVRSLNL